MRTFNTYDAARAHASRMARKTGLHVGVEKCELTGKTVIRFIPSPEKSFGPDLRCERVRPDEPLWTAASPST